MHVEQTEFSKVDASVVNSGEKDRPIWNRIMKAHTYTLL